MRYGLIAIAGIGIGCLGWGIYVASEWHACSDLERQFFDSAHAIRDASRNNYDLGRIGVPTDAEAHGKAQGLRLKIMGLNYNALADRCGVDTASQANREARDILRDGMDDILSSP